MELGIKVTARAVLRRYTRPREVDGQRNYGNGHYAYWKACTIGARQGLLIGLRSLYDGVVTWDFDYGNTFAPDKTVKAALVVFSLREKPVYVPIESLEVQDG